MLEPNLLDKRAAVMIEAPDTADRYLLYRADTGPGGLVIGTSLAVAEQEHALICVQGRIINTLEVGIYTLDLEQLADLAALFSWPADYQGVTDAEVIFVSAAKAHRHIWRNPPDQPIRTGEDESSILLTGTLDFGISDCRRFAHARLESARLGDEEFYRTLDRMLLRECRKLILEEQWSSERLLAARDTFAQTLKTRLQSGLEQQGLSDIRLKIRHIEARKGHKQGTTEGIATDPPGEEPGDPDSSLTHDSDAQDNQDSQDSQDDQGSDQAPLDLPPLREIELALEQFEAEILELDAWGTIREPAPTETRPSSSAPDVEVGESGIERFRQWLGDGVFHVAVDQQPSGPYDATELVRLVRDGTITRGTLVWRQGMDDWTQAGDVPEIVLLLDPDD